MSILQIRQLGVLLVFATLLAGCVTTEPGSSEQQSLNTAPSSDEDEVIASTPTEPKAQETSEQQALARPPSKEEEDTIEVDDNPETLMGLDKPALERQLGAPHFVRLEHPAEIWQYKSNDCVFDLFLYPDEEQRRVTFWEARDLSASPTEARPCLREFLLSQARKTA